MSTRSTASSSPRRRRAPPPPGAAREEISSTLATIGVRPSRRLGQSFLVDPFVADAEAALALGPWGEEVVEIGGGLGVVTAALLRRGANLTVIEKDVRLARFLRERFGDRVRVVTGDALTLPLPPAACVVGNLPFSVGTPILLRVLAARIPRIVFLLQEEVAERLAAGPGSKAYGRLSLIARLYGSVDLFQPVPRIAFVPQPRVNGRVGVHTARTGDLPVHSVATFERAVRTLFGSRRKQLSNLLPRLASSPEDAARLAERSGWPADWGRRRPEELAPEQFFALSRSLDERSPTR